MRRVYSFFSFVTNENPWTSANTLLNKRRGILYNRLSHDQALALPPQRISNALAHAVRFISNHFSHLKEILHFVAFGPLRAANFVSE